MTTDFLSLLFHKIPVEDFSAFSKQYTRLKGEITLKKCPNYIIAVKFIDLLLELHGELAQEKRHKELSAALRRDLCASVEDFLDKAYSVDVVKYYVNCLLTLKAHKALKRLFLAYYTKSPEPFGEVISYFYACDVPVARTLMQLYARKWRSSLPTWILFYKEESRIQSSQSVLDVISSSAKEALLARDYSEFISSVASH